MKRVDMRLDADGLFGRGASGTGWIAASLSESQIKPTATFGVIHAKTGPRWGRWFQALGLRSSADLLVSRHSLGYREGASGTRSESMLIDALVN